MPFSSTPKLSPYEVVEQYLTMRCIKNREILSSNSLNFQLAVENTVRLCGPKTKEHEQHVRSLATATELKTMANITSASIFEGLQILLCLCTAAYFQGDQETGAEMLIRAMQIVDASVNGLTPVQTLDKMIKELVQFSEVNNHEP